MGGVDKKYVKLKSVESFDPSTGKWSPEPDMLTARYNCGVEEAAVRTLRHVLAAMVPVDVGTEHRRGCALDCTSVRPLALLCVLHVCRACVRVCGK